MKNIEIIFEERNLVIEGTQQEADPQSGINSDYFDFDSIKEDGLEVEDLHYRELWKIEELVMKAIKDNNQADWESANA